MMHLRHRCACNRLRIEALEDLAHGLAVGAMERGQHVGQRERRHPVLQLRELVGDIGRQEIAPRRQHLPELDEDRAEGGERLAQAHRARRREIAPEERPVDHGAQPAHPRVRQHELVEPVLHCHRHDAGKTRDSHSRDCTGGELRYRTKGGRRLRGGLAGLAAPAARGAVTLRASPGGAAGGGARRVVPRALIVRRRRR